MVMRRAMSPSFSCVKELYLVAHIEVLQRGIGLVLRGNFADDRDEEGFAYGKFADRDGFGDLLDGSDFTVVFALTSALIAANSVALGGSSYLSEPTAGNSGRTPNVAATPAPSPTATPTPS
jgi:hypothetical protein